MIASTSAKEFKRKCRHKLSTHPINPSSWYTLSAYYLDLPLTHPSGRQWHTLWRLCQWPLCLRRHVTYPWSTPHPPSHLIRWLGNDIAAELYGQITELHIDIGTAIEEALQREPEVAERLFKLNDDAQVVKIAYEGVCDGGTSLSMAMELVNSLSVMQQRSSTPTQPPPPAPQNPPLNAAKQTAARASEQPSLIDTLGEDNDPFDLNPLQSSSSSLSQPSTRYGISHTTFQYTVPSIWHTPISISIYLCQQA